MTTTQKNKFSIFTKKDFKAIPDNVIIIKDDNGWTFMSNLNAIWYVNSTNDNKDCLEKDYEKFIKKLVKALKEQMKLI